jgi:hypothetical protein
VTIGYPLLGEAAIGRLSEASCSALDTAVEQAGGGNATQSVIDFKVRTDEGGAAILHGHLLSCIGVPGIKNRQGEA